jgi:hypothetical protein
MRTIGLSDPRVLLPLFLVESTSDGYIAMAYCECLSLVLILVVKILGGGARPARVGILLYWKRPPLAGRQINTHTAFSYDKETHDGNDGVCRRVCGQ